MEHIREETWLWKGNRNRVYDATHTSNKWFIMLQKSNCTTSEDHMTRLCYISLRARGAYLSRVYYRLYPSGTNKRPLLSMRYYTIVTTKLYLKYSSPYSMWRAIRVCVASSQRFTWRMIVKLFTFATFVIINIYTPFLSPRTSRCVVCLLSDSLFNAI